MRQDAPWENDPVWNIDGMWQAIRRKFSGLASIRLDLTAMMNTVKHLQIMSAAIRDATSQLRPRHEIF